MLLARAERWTDSFRDSKRIWLWNGSGIGQARQWAAVGPAWPQSLDWALPSLGQRSSSKGFLWLHTNQAEWWTEAKKMGLLPETKGKNMWLGWGPGLARTSPWKMLRKQHNFFLSLFHSETCQALVLHLFVFLLYFFSHCTRVCYFFSMSQERAIS